MIARFLFRLENFISDPLFANVPGARAISSKGSMVWKEVATESMRAFPGKPDSSGGEEPKIAAVFSSTMIRAWNLCLQYQIFLTKFLMFVQGFPLKKGHVHVKWNNITDLYMYF